MSRNDYRFTGGEGVQPGTLRHAVHLAMMTNELSGGRGAYRMSNAVLAESGPSFGPFQYDLGSSPEGRVLFENIARSARDSQGNRFLQDGDLQEIQEHLYKSFKKINANPADLEAFNRLRPHMDKALSSDAGRRIINQDYVASLDKKIQALDAAIDSIANSDNRAFMQGNRLAQLIVIDTANQYGPPVNKGLRAFMGMDEDSAPINMPGRARRERIGVEGTLGLEDLIRYKLETQYGQTDTGARDVLRRISNLIDAAGPDNIALSQEDRRFFARGLREYLRENGRNPEMLDDPELRTLKTLSARAAHGLPEIASTPSADSPNAVSALDAAMIERLRTGVQALDRAASKTWDDYSERLLASAYGLARNSGFTAGDDLRLAVSQPTPNGAGGTRVFVCRLGPTASPDPAANRAHMTMSDALAVPAAERYAQISASEQVQAYMNPPSPALEEARRGPTLS